jgi:hypothetical protein
LQQFSRGRAAGSSSTIDNYRLGTVGKHFGDNLFEDGPAEVSSALDVTAEIFAFFPNINK